MVQEHGKQSFLMQVQARHTQAMLDALVDIETEGDPFSTAQAFMFMTQAYCYTQSAFSALGCMKKAADIIRKHRIRFVPTSMKGDPSLEPLELAHERAALLAQMVYFKEGLYLLGQKSSSVNKDVQDVMHVCFQAAFQALTA